VGHAPQTSVKALALNVLAASRAVPLDERPGTHRKVGDGEKNHPPKYGDEYRKWLESWQPKGKVQ
jgi:hypothetical protein